jgi:hypothetical protein
VAYTMEGLLSVLRPHCPVKVDALVNAGAIMHRLAGAKIHQRC